MAKLANCLPAGRRSGRDVHVYALISEADGGLYVGFSEHLARRLSQDNSGQTRSTRGRTPFRVIYTEVAATRAEARVREKYLKSGSGREFLKKTPGWRNWQTQRT